MQIKIDAGEMKSNLSLKGELMKVTIDVNGGAAYEGYSTASK